MIKFGLILATVAVVSVTAVDRHKIVYKSLQRAAYECGQYSAVGPCLGRCETLVTRDWNDTKGMSPAYSRFFVPDPVDQCNLNRTERCLLNKVYTVPRSRSCVRANESVQCYLDQYGQVNLTAPQFIRFTPLIDDQIVRDCSAMVGLSMEQVYAFSSKGVSHYIVVNAKDSTLTASNTESDNTISISRTNSDTIVYGDTNDLYNYIDDYYSG
nr:general odorant-binding protein 45-like [Aedes albopictus]